MFALGAIARGASSASQGDWLSFAGALLGSAITVTGSIIVLEWQRTKEARAQKKLLLELLNEADAACIPFQYANGAALEAKTGQIWEA